MDRKDNNSRKKITWLIVSIAATLILFFASNTFSPGRGGHKKYTDRDYYGHSACVRNNGREKII